MVVVVNIALTHLSAPLFWGSMFFEASPPSHPAAGRASEPKRRRDDFRALRSLLRPLLTVPCPIGDGTAWAARCLLHPSGSSALLGSVLGGPEGVFGHEVGVADVDGAVVGRVQLLVTLEERLVAVVVERQLPGPSRLVRRAWRSRRRLLRAFGIRRTFFRGLQAWPSLRGPTVSFRVSAPPRAPSLPSALSTCPGCLGSWASPSC